MTWYIKIPSLAVEVYSSQRPHRASPARLVTSKRASLTALVAEVNKVSVVVVVVAVVLLEEG